MSIFAHRAFDQHEGVYFWHRPELQLSAIIAIHSTTLGPAAGGCRSWHYQNDDEAIEDVLRLAQGMSYKNAMAGLALGGGKAVILRGRESLTAAQMQSFGEFVDSLGGRYITAEDVGLSVALMREVASVTSYVAGLPVADGAAGGDPSPKTAYGAFVGIKAAVAERLGRDSVAGLTVAVQGVGNVGSHLCDYLADAGCKLKISDVDESRVRAVAERTQAEIVALDQIVTADCDVLAPCALGAIINADTVGAIQAPVVAGAANNQLATEQDGRALTERNVLYCPDYVINAGGIINVAYEYEQRGDEQEVIAKVEEIGPRLTAIFDTAQQRDLPTNIVADQMAAAKIGRTTGAAS